MNLPYIDELIKYFDSKFTLCIVAAKRAKELGNYLMAKKKMERTNIVKPLVDLKSNDPLEVALNEIKEGKVGYVRVKDGIK
ncbi:MAG: DNA-directed RNA polymerase subunit omega [Actinobacteria bacterium]|nr:DNA-directed RNA polymerase subunit omega [Actinomycetota bacterium]